MKRVRAEQPPVDGNLSGIWCNDNAVTTSQMEAISLITPVLESFFMRTVAEALPKPARHDELESRCVEFIREEANHSRIHKAFNDELLGYLGKPPPGLRLADWLLKQVRNRFSLASQLLLAAALEHFAAVMSHVYMHRAETMPMSSDYARDMFAMHAEEEIGHRSVVFDLWARHGVTGRFGRTLVILAIIVGSGLYSAISVPWILYRKYNGSLGATFKGLFGFFIHNWRDVRDFSPLGAIFSFVRRDYHPDKLVES